MSILDSLGLGPLFRNKWFVLVLGVLGVGILIYIFYVTKTANDDAKQAASAVAGGSVGSTVGSNIGGFFSGLWNKVSSIWKGNSSTTGAVPGSSTALVS